MKMTSLFPTFILSLAAAVVLVLAACAAPQETSGQRAERTAAEQPSEGEARKAAAPLLRDDIRTLPDGTKYLVHPDEFRSGGPGKGGIGESGGIPALFEPTLIPAAEASYLTDEELVLGIVWKGEARAYPYQILVWHELANDMIQGDPILVTYCPLCFTGIVFDATVEGKRELFGVSGKLYNSELVMYDKSTESYWPQSLGKAVVGERTGTVLRKIPVDVTRWGDWKKAHPDTKVLSRETGFARQYGSNPYGSGRDFADIRFRLGVEKPDPRLPAQAIVYGVEAGGAFKAYPDAVVGELAVINDAVGDVPVVVWLDAAIGGPKAFLRTVEGKGLTFAVQDGLFADEETGSGWDAGGMAVSGQLKGTQLERIVHEPVFWFAWAAFHPETALYSKAY